LYLLRPAVLLRLEAQYYRHTSASVGGTDAGEAGADDPFSITVPDIFCRGSHIQLGSGANCLALVGRVNFLYCNLQFFAENRTRRGSRSFVGLTVLSHKLCNMYGCLLYAIWMLLHAESFSLVDHLY
jgi:hypothetical protein